MKTQLFATTTMLVLATSATGQNFIEAAAPSVHQSGRIKAEGVMDDKFPLCIVKSSPALESAFNMGTEPPDPVTAGILRQPLIDFSR